MPWKETTTIEQKIEFICEWITGKYTITELCKSFEISRPTAYRLIDRFEKKGYEGLREQSEILTQMFFDAAVEGADKVEYAEDGRVNSVTFYLTKDEPAKKQSFWNKLKRRIKK